MRYGRIIVAFLTAALAALFLLVGNREVPVEEIDIPLSFFVESAENTEQIRCWEDMDGAFFAFLPGYARMDQVYLSTGKAEIWIGNVPVSDKMSCERFLLNTKYPFSCTQDGNHLESTITFMQSANVPSLYIDVQSGSMEYIHYRKGNEESGFLRLYAKTGELLHSGQLESIKGRGNASWTPDKKPYSLTLTQTADLLDMGSAQKWILLADGDNPVNLRNKLVYDFAHAFELSNSPDCEWVDLYLNGEYAGLYLLSERNEIHEERVPAAGTGSFLVSRELESRLKDQSYPYVLTESGQALRIHYGVENASQMQQQWQSAENAILSADGTDPLTGKEWQELIDLDSWARKYLIEEIFANNDGGFLSQYYYFDSNNPERKIYAGPVWDYDYAMGGSSVWLKPYSDYLTMDRSQASETVYAPWFSSLCDKPVFLNYVKALYQSEMLVLLEELLDTRIDEYLQYIYVAASTDAVRWNLEPNRIVEDVEYIKTFLRKRAAFFSDMWFNDVEYHTVCADPGRYGLFGYFAVKDGSTLPELPSGEMLGGLGWYNADTDEPFDITQPIFEDTNIYVKKPKAPLPMIHYLPVLALTAMLFLLIVGDRIQTRKNGRMRRAAAKVK